MATKLKRSVEVFDTDNKYKLVLTVDVLGKRFTVVKLYHDDTDYDEALLEAEERLSKMLDEGFEEGSNKKIAYLMDGYGQTTKEAN